MIAVAFHFLLSYSIQSWPLAIFAILVAIGTIVVSFVVKGIRNSWAILFLVPLVCASIGTSLYSSDAVKLISFLMIVLSLAALAYWLTAPSTDWKKGLPLWNPRLLVETVWPFPRYQLLFSEPMGTKHKINGKTLLQMLIGLIVALPVFAVFATLFMDGDLFFQEMVNRWFHISMTEDDVVRLFFDLVILVYASAFFWGLVRRSREVVVAHEPRTPFTEIVAARTFLCVITALFVVFAGFQIFYLFQGSEYIQAQGTTYSQYAVSGYSQLCAAAAFSFLLLLVLYRLTKMEDRWINLGSYLIAASSFISTLSAGKRLWLYVDAYGFTLSRWWGAQGLLVICFLLVLLMVCIQQRKTLGQLITYSTIGVATLLSITIVINHEALVANYNLRRHMAYIGPRLDLTYLATSLSSDAVPAIASFLARADWRDEQTNTSRQQVYMLWQNANSYSPDADPRTLTLSDVRAHLVINTLEKR